MPQNWQTIKVQGIDFDKIRIVKEKTVIKNKKRLVILFLRNFI